MSFPRLIFYHAMLGGWAALVGWLVSELFFLQRRSTDIGLGALLMTAALVGAAIAGGISLLGAISNGRLRGNVLRLGFCLIGGFLGGMVGGLIGNGLFELLRESLGVVPRILGWMILGLGIGGVEGLFDRSPKKIRNGLIGGALGGLLGGLCFDPVVQLVGGNMSGRAVAFVLLGLSIGLFIGLAQIILREAWLTVEQGFRPGRQLILDLPVTALGTSEKAQLPFIAFGAKGVEPIHVKVVRQADGTFLVCDNATRGGTLLNGERVTEEVLRDDDTIQLGPNVVRFREVVRHVSREPTPRRARVAPPPVPTVVPPVPPPMPPPMPAPRVATSTGSPFDPPASVRTIQPKPAPMGPRGKPCPKCGKAATPIPGGGQHLCMSCDLKF